MFWGHTCLLYSEGAFYIPEVGPGLEVKLTGRYVPAGQLSVESENRRCSHPAFSAPACRTYDIKSITMKTIDAYTFFSCDQAALQMVFSVCPSVRLSVRLSVTPFWLCSHHRIIMTFSGVITNDRRKVHAKGQGQRSKVKVTEVTTPLSRFRTVTPVWIHIWWRNDAYSLMLLRRGALLFFKVIRKISRSHGSKNRGIWPRLGVSGL